MSGFIKLFDGKTTKLVVTKLSIQTAAPTSKSSDLLQTPPTSKSNRGTLSIERRKRHRKRRLHKILQEL